MTTTEQLKLIRQPAILGFSDRNYDGIIWPQAEIRPNPPTGGEDGLKSSDRTFLKLWDHLFSLRQIPDLSVHLGATYQNHRPPISETAAEVRGARFLPNGEAVFAGPVGFDTLVVISGFERGVYVARLSYGDFGSGEVKDIIGRADKPGAELTAHFFGACPLAGLETAKLRADYKKQIWLPFLRHSLGAPHLKLATHWNPVKEGFLWLAVRPQAGQVPEIFLGPWH